MRRAYLERLTTAISLLLLLVPAMIASASAAAGSPVKADFYVAADGDDSSDGSIERPFATLARAREALRARLTAEPGRNRTVLVRGGTYRISEPIVFEPQDGGSAKASVTYAAYPGERPIISGGRVITGWRVESNGLWSVQLPAVKAGQWAFRQLFVGDRRAVRARHPNQGWLRVEKVGADRRTSFQFRAGDLAAWPDLAQTELVFLHDWSITRVPVKAIDEAARTLTVQHQIGGPSRWAVMNWFEKQPRYFIENSAALLDEPGEWFLDRKTGHLSYHPLAEEKPGQVRIVAPVAKQLLVVQGDSAGGRVVRNLHFRGLVFEHAAWSPPGGVYWGRQACTYWSLNTDQTDKSHEEADPAAVQFTLAKDCSFAEGSVRHVGSSAVWLGRGCRDCRIVGCAVSDAGGNGIMVGEGQARMIGDKAWWEAVPEQAARGNRVAHNFVEGSGRLLFGAVGIWVGLAGQTAIAHNEVRQHPYTGVSIGWMWWNPRSRPEPRSTPCCQTLVENNHIHHVMQTLSDGGGIYALGTQPDSALRGNLIHDVPLNAGRAESNGMFLDQGTGEFVIENNVIYAIDRSPLRFHKGWKNLVRNNVLAVRKGVAPVRYNDTKQERITLQDNKILQSEAGLQEAIQKILPHVGPQAPYRERLAQF